MYLCLCILHELNQKITSFHQTHFFVPFGCNKIFRDFSTAHVIIHTPSFRWQPVIDSVLLNNHIHQNISKKLLHVSEDTQKDTGVHFACMNLSLLFHPGSYLNLSPFHSLL